MAKKSDDPVSFADNFFLGSESHPVSLCLRDQVNPKPEHSRQSSKMSVQGNLALKKARKNAIAQCLKAIHVQLVRISP